MQKRTSFIFTLEVELLGTPEALVTNYQTTGCNIREDNILPV